MFSKSSWTWRLNLLWCSNAGLDAADCHGRVTTKVIRRSGECAVRDSCWHYGWCHYCTIQLWSACVICDLAATCCNHISTPFFWAACSVYWFTLYWLVVPGAFCYYYSTSFAGSPRPETRCVVCVKRQPFEVMIIGDIVPSFLGFLNAPEILQDRTLVLVLSGLLVLMPLSSMPRTSPRWGWTMVTIDPGSMG